MRQSFVGVGRRGGVCVALAILATVPAAVWGSSTFYVSPNGNDNADGLTPQTAWKTLDKASTTSYLPGTNVLFERGGEWRGRLTATSSGTVDAPITYGAYGSGSKPKFYGSDILDKAGFQQVAGTSTTYAIQQAAPVGSVLASGTFLRSSYLNTKMSNDPAVNKAYVNANPGTWYYDSAAQSLIVNTGSSIASDSRQLTAVTRDDVVVDHDKDNIVFSNLVVDETAKYGLGGSGYAFRVERTKNVKIIDSEAYRAGKHHFGALNSTGFVGQGLTAKYSMPDQGIGGASPLVSYSEAAYPNSTYTWENVQVSDVGDPTYPAWVSHGEGIGHITLNNISSIGSSIALGGHTTATNLRIVGGGATAGQGDTIDGLWMNGALSLYDNALVRNMVIDQWTFDSGYPAPIVSYGTGSVVELSTVTIARSWWPYLSLFALNGDVSDLTVRGTIFDSALGTSVMYDPSKIDRLHTDYSLFTDNVFFTDAAGNRITFEQWQLLTGGDVNSEQGAAGFIDAARGDYRRLLNAAGTDQIPYDLFPDGVVDFDGVRRPQGAGIDIGAFERLVPEPSGAVLVVGAGLLGLTRRRR